MDLYEPIPIVLAFALTILLYYLISIKTKGKGKGKGKGELVAVPNAEGALPLIGHVHLFGGPSPMHQVLGKMADRNGPIYAIKMGIHKAVIVSSWEIAKECLTVDDKAIAGRPRMVFFEVMAYNSMFSFSSYGPYWRYIRRVVVAEVLSNHRMGLLEHVKESEVRAAIRGVYFQWKAKKPLVEMREVFGDIVLNVILRMIVGKRYEDENDNKRGRETLRYGFELAGRSLVSDAFPFLRWLDIGGHEKEMKIAACEIDHLVQGWLDEHRTRRKLGVKESSDNEVDFMDVMISIIDGGQEQIPPGYDADTVIKATCLGLVAAGSDTTMVSLTWALSLLLNNKEALRKARQELDAVIGRDRQVKENDLKDLPYIQAIIKETLRLYPAAPLSLPHEATEDCTINGYHIEKGTRILFNLSKIQREPKVWVDPEEFRPERFLTTHKDVDVRGQNFELIPFGSGRRICAGISMALQMFGLSLASFLHGFEVARPLNEPVDMTEAIGITNLKATPLQVLVTPRLAESLYDL